MIKYLPDALILIGIWMFSYVSFFPVKKNFDFSISSPDYSNYFKLLAIILISIGVDIAIRKIVNKK